MEWFEVLKVIAIVILFFWCLDLMRQNKQLKEKNSRLLRDSGKYEEIKAEAKQLLTEMTEIKVIKTLRGKYDLSLIDAKQLVDETKQGS